MLRWIVIFLAAFWLVRQVGRILFRHGGRTLGHGSGSQERFGRSPDREPELSRQEIADADFEEISEEE